MRRGRADLAGVSDWRAPDAPLSDVVGWTSAVTPGEPPREGRARRTPRPPKQAKVVSVARDRAGYFALGAILGAAGAVSLLAALGAKIPG